MYVFHVFGGFAVVFAARVDELSEKRRVYDSNAHIAAKMKGVKYSPYLHQVPCRCGAEMEYAKPLARRV